MKFSYVKFDNKFLPIVPIRLKGKEWVEFKAFVDTGAGYSIFYYDVAEILGLNLEKGQREFVKIGDGSFIEVFAFRILVSLAGKEFESKIGFSRSLGVGFNILGRQDIFDNFRVCFDESERTIDFQPK